MELLNLPFDQFAVFLLILIRVSVVLMLLPFFGSNVFPVLVKAGLSLLISFSIVPGLDPSIFVLPENLISLLIFVVSEFILGLTIGLILRMYFASIQLAGELISFQMGFSMINVLDPQTGSQVAVLDQIGNWVVLLVFLLLNGHLYLISVVVKSFDLIKVGEIFLDQKLLDRIILCFSLIFSQAFKIGAPVIVALLCVSVSFGLMAKFAPQMNILVAAFPVKIVVGLFFFVFILQIILITTKQYMMEFKQLMNGVLVLMGGGLSG